MTVEILERRKGMYPSMSEASPPSKWRFTCDGCGLQETQSVDDPPGRTSGLGSGTVTVMPSGGIVRIIGYPTTFHFCKDDMRCLRKAALNVVAEHLDRCIDENGDLRSPSRAREQEEVSAVKWDNKRGHTG